MRVLTFFVAVLLVASVAGRILSELVRPVNVRLARLGHCCLLAAGVLMPETAMDEYDGAVPREYDVGFSL